MSKNRNRTRRIYGIILTSFIIIWIGSVSLQMLSNRHNAWIASEMILQQLEDVIEAKLSQTDPVLPQTELKGKKNEAVEALVSLGYSSSEALKVLSGITITEESTVEDILKEALKAMAFL